MKLIFKALVIIILITTSNNLIAQDQIIKEENHQQTSKMYDYEFTGMLNTSQQEQLRLEVANMQFVTEAKIYYKPEKGSGMIRLLTKEYYTNSDTDFEFNIYNLKMLISKFNLTPIEYRSEIITK